MEQIKEKTTEVAIIDFRSLPEYQGARERQQALLAANPYLEITTPADATMARARRTALRGGRTELQKGLKVIKGKVKGFVDMVTNETDELIGITKEAEDKQQAEIDRYDELKRQEKEERAKIERERIQKHQNTIKAFREEKLQALSSATVKTINAIIDDIASTNLDVEEFEENFYEVKKELMKLAEQKEMNLVEAERLRVEREKAEARRKEEEESRKKAEAERQKAEDEARKKREAEEMELKKKREELERKEAELKRKEDERIAREKAEQKEREEKERIAAEEAQKKEFARRYLIMLAEGYEYKENEAVFYFGNVVIEKWEVEQGTEEQFIKELLPDFREMYQNEVSRMEAIKPDREKLMELVNKLHAIAKPQLVTDKANALLTKMEDELNGLLESHVELIKEL